MSAPWQSTPIDPNDPAAQAQAQAALAAAQIQAQVQQIAGNVRNVAVPTAGNVRNVAVPEGQTVTSFGAPQVGAVSAADYATGRYAPFNPTGWTRTGGSSTGSVYVNDKTGERVYVAPDGRVQDHFTAEEAAQADKNLSAAGAAEQMKDEVRKTAREGKEIADQTNVVGTPGIDPSVEKQVNDAVLGPDDIRTLIGGVSLGGGGGPSSVTDPIQQAIARQAAIADASGAAAANYSPVAAPTVAGPGQISASNAAQLDPVQAAIAQAQEAQAARVDQTALTPQQAAIQAQQIEAARIAQLQQAQVAQVAPTQVGPTSLANAAQINTDPQAEIRAAQTGLVSGLQSAIAGKEPSVAEIMLRNATDRNVANQYALAQAANGMNTGLAQRTAMINAAEMNQTAVMQQAILRAQEIASARGQLAGVTDSTRGADIGLATNQAGLQQQTSLTNTGALNTANLTQAQIAAAQATQQAQLQQGASQFNAGQANDAASQQAQLQQAAALANQQAALGASTTSTTLAQQAAIANSAAQNQTYQTNAQLQQGAALQNAQLGTQAAIANAGNQTSANTSSSQLANAVNLANANNQTQAGLTQAQLQTQANIAGANNQVSTNALNQKAQQDLAANQLAAAGQAGQTSVGAGDVAAKFADAEAKKEAALLGGLGTAGAALLASDRREKTDITKAEAEIAEFTSTLKPYAFRYREPEKPGRAPGQRFGIMAQDLEKSAVGRTLVREMEDGTKAIDVPQSIGAILATLSAMNRRIEARA